MHGANNVLLSSPSRRCRSDVQAFYRATYMDSLFFPTHFGAHPHACQRGPRSHGVLRSPPTNVPTSVARPKADSKQARASTAYPLSSRGRNGTVVRRDCVPVVSKCSGGLRGPVWSFNAMMAGGAARNRTEGYWCCPAACERCGFKGHASCSDPNCCHPRFKFPPISKLCGEGRPPAETNCIVTEQQRARQGCRETESGADRTSVLAQRKKGSHARGGGRRLTQAAPPETHHPR